MESRHLPPISAPPIIGPPITLPLIAGSPPTLLAPGPGAAPLIAGRPGAGRARLAAPAGTSGRRILWPYALAVGGFHALALLALLPWCFSWAGVVVAFVGLYMFGVLGINLYYHRLLTHRGFRVPMWLDHGLAVLGVCCLQDTPARWVAVHRRHHEMSDRREDPHSPLVTFLWGHVGWMLVENTELRRLSIYERYARDILRDPFQRRLERHYASVLVASWVVFFAAGLGAALLAGDSLAGALQFGASILVWGVVVRTVLVWHITWSVNSLAHLWGYRSHSTADDSRNNWFVALITSGEGWHNNHHAQPRAASHGHTRWEPDLVFLIIRGLGRLGLARDIIRPKLPTR